MSKILDIPFNEPANSQVAYDYAPGHNNAIIHGATFETGKVGYAVKFKGDDYARIDNPGIDLTGEFTASFWLKARQFPPYDAPQVMKFQFAFSDDSIMELQTPVMLNEWVFYAWVKKTTGATLYVNGADVGSINFTAGDPVEYAIQQFSGDGSGFPYTLPLTFGSNGAPYGLGDMDELLIYNEALSAQDINNQYAGNKDRRAFYFIDEKPFEDFLVYVSTSSGQIDALELKESVNVDWPGEHGIIIDLERRRFKERVIKLDCFVKCAGYMDFALKLNDFLDRFTQNGLHRLRIDIDDYKHLVYEVYLPGGTDINKKWREGDFFGTFSLELREPEPVKRVLRFEATTANMTAKINMQGKKGAYNIFWGDKQSDKDIFCETSQLMTHTFQQEGIYYIIVAGAIDDLINFSHNAVLVWNKL